MSVTYLAEWKRDHPPKKCEPVNPLVFWWKVGFFLMWGKWL